MPKKRQPQSLLTKPSSTAPATLSSARAGNSQNDVQAENVNDLLQQLRISQRTEHALPKPATMASVHPSLRNVLNIPETAAPRPRSGMTPRSHGPTRVRRIPGPPAPQSWLLKSKHTPEDTKLLTDSACTLQHRSIKLPEAYLPDEKSLQHSLLKAMASNWNWHSEHAGVYLLQIPLRLRETLLSYLSVFSDGYILSNPLPLLFPLSGDLRDEGDQDEAQDVKRLDLTNALGTWLSLTALRRAIVMTQSTSHRKVPQSNPYNSADSIAEEVPESWEDAEEEDNEPPVKRPVIDSGGIPKSLHTSRFPNLLHLSLAVDPILSSTVVSWSTLIGIANHLHTLESLSLAYWPLPTYTPAAAATYATIDSNVLGARRRIAYGGTNMYSVLENDWRESTGILKSLSRSLYCLKWLDLTGCVSWLPALVWEEETLSTSVDSEYSPFASEMKTGHQNSTPILNGYWRGVIWLGLGVGWTPAGELEDSAFTRLARDYNTLWQKVDKVAKQVRESRIAGKGQPITIDCGIGPIMQGTNAMPQALHN